MTVSHSTNMRNSLADNVDATINSGSTDAQGDFVVMDGTTDLAEFNLQDPAFGAASSGVITLQGTTLTTTAGTAGTADTFEIRDKNNAMQVTGSVTATGGGGDVEIDNTSINSGQQVDLTSLTYEASV